MKVYQLHIKNMVCERCIYFVEQSLKQLKVHKTQVELGRASFLSAQDNIVERLETKLSEVGLSILRTKEEVLLESIKQEVGNYLDGLEQRSWKRTFSNFLQKRLGKGYANLSKFFKDNEQTTLEFYVITQKVERVKRLIRENELLLKEIAERLHYSSLQHLSAQFRHVTGFTVTQFKKRVISKSLPLSLSNVLSNLRVRGFIHHFEIKGNSLRLGQPAKKMSLKEATLKEVYRFEDIPAGYGKSVVLEVETLDGLKGYAICQ